MFQKAVRHQSKLKLAMTGPSGSGKTLSALLIAKGIGGKVAVIDTENGSASLYAGRPDVPEFDVLNLSPPYTTLKYLDAMAGAAKAGYEILIIDSISHQWAGEGGILQKKEHLDAGGKGNSYANWGKLTPEQEKFKSAMLHFPKHLIATMRSKQDYAQIEEGGKKKIQKLGMAPVQRDGMEYEFTVVLDMDMANQAQASKDRTDMFRDRIFKPSEETGRELLAWLNHGEVLAAVDTPTDVQRAYILGACQKLGVPAPVLKSRDHADGLIVRLNAETAKRAKEAARTPANPMTDDGHNYPDEVYDPSGEVPPLGDGFTAEIIPW